MELPENIQKLIKRFGLKTRWKEINTQPISDLSKMVVIEDLIEEKRQAQVEYNKKNKEKNSERSRQWYQKNRAHQLEKVSQWYRNNKDKKSEYDKQYREENIEKISERTKQWNQENREHLKQHKQNAYTTGKSILLQLRGNRCEVSGVSGEDHTLFWAHIVPRALLKSHGIDAKVIPSFYQNIDPLSNPRCVEELTRVALVSHEVHLAWDLIWHIHWKRPRYPQNHETWEIFKHHYKFFMESDYTFYGDFLEDNPPVGLEPVSLDEYEEKYFGEEDQ